MSQISMGGAPQRLVAKDLLTPGEVAALFAVETRTVTRWARAGKLPSVRTLGGHRRYLASDIRRLLDGGHVADATGTTPSGLTSFSTPTRVASHR
ncbi:MAG: BldC family transcriptional regulator [Nocardioidaceae bacterium]|nr:BldC family transcriptional regulator [Nocardioidaceae bacterium]